MGFFAMIGETVSHYRILSQLGHGGMGVVYAAEDTHLGRRVAIKFANAEVGDSLYRARFLREARAASALDHPNIAGIYDYGEMPDGQPFLVMELVEGESLFELMRRGPMPLGQVCRIAGEVAEALGEAHHRGILHRDIKPSNIVINERGQVKVLDFGLAKLYREPRPPDQTDPTVTSVETIAGTVLGTPQYMSPEQAQDGQLGPQSDLFALGAVLYECLTGRPAFGGGNSVAILGAVLHLEPPAPSAVDPRVPPELDRVAAKALAKRVEDRYQSAAEMVADLRAVRAAMVDNSTQETEVLPVAKSGPRLAGLRTLAGPLHRRRYPVAIALGLVVASAATWLWLATRPYRPAAEALRWYREGVEALRDGTYYKASKALEQAVKLDPVFAMAHARLAEAWLELDYTDQAKEEMLRASAPGTSPRVERADQWYLEALHFTLTGDFAHAVEKYRQIADAAPDAAKADAEVDLGRAYERSEKSADALQSYQNAVRRQRQTPAAWMHLGILYGRQNEAAKAAQAFNEAEQLYRALTNLEGVTEVLYQRGALANTAGRGTEARALFEQALDLARSTGSVSQQIVTLLQRSSLELRLNELEACQADAAKAIELARANGLEGLTARGLLSLGNAYFLKGEYEEARKYFQQGLEYARLHRSERTEARALFSLGSLAFQTGDTAAAEREVQQAIAWYQQGGYQREIGRALILLSRVERKSGDLPAALESLERQIEVARKAEDQTQIALAQQGIAIVMEEQGRWPEALAQFREAYRTAKESGDRQNAAYDLAGVSSMLWQLGRYEEARQSLESIGAEAPPAVLAITVGTRAEMELSQRQFAAAIASARQAALKPGTSTEVQGVAKRVLGLAQAASGAAREGVASAAEAETLAEKSRDPFAIAAARLAHADALLAAGSSRDALDTALAAQSWCARAGNLAMEWRCWLLAARAESALHGAAKAGEYAARAAGALAELGRKWDSESYKTYLGRPDISYDRGQLSRLAGTK